MLMVEGLTSAGADRVLDYRDHPELDETDRLVVEYTIAVTNTPQRVGDALFARLRARFSEAEIVELTLRIALCGFFNRFNDALQIEDAGASEAGRAEAARA
jgi:alkylhydroperoxidase family enzyme